MYWDTRLSNDARAIKASEIRELLKVMEDPEILSFAGGIPDPDLFPVEQVRKIRSALDKQTRLHRQSLQYSATEGYAPLRAWIRDTFSTTEVRLDTANILVTNGAQQSLTLLATALIDNHALIAVANPTYLGALQVFEARRPEFVSVATDDNGLIMEDLEEAFKKGVKFLYTIPDFQNPGGMTLPLDRRLRMLELAHDYGVPILEDTAYRALWYDRPPPPSLLEIEGRILGAHKWEREGLVIQIGTASKTLMPALRVGWTIAPRDLLDKLVILKQANDLCSSSINQIVAHELASNYLPEHVLVLREKYAERRDAMVAALRQHLPNNVHFSAPAGGMFVWLTLPQGMDANDLLEKALSLEKLAFVPGAAFHASGGGENTLRLSFSTCPPDIIADGMERLCKLIKSEEAAKPERLHS
jgi:2-aminoadipate transaminase